MSYRLTYTHKAVKDLDAIDPATKRRIGKTLQRYEKDPLAHAEQMTALVVRPTVKEIVL